MSGIDMSHKHPLIVGTTLGLVHIFLVGMPFVQSGGGGEATGYLVLFVDFPLYLMAEIAFPRLLLNSVPFNFFWFVVLGTLMYGSIGYGLGLLSDRVSERKNAET
jgi:hypothetical protein